MKDIVKILLTFFLIITSYTTTAARKVLAVQAAVPVATADDQLPRSTPNISVRGRDMMSAMVII
jgi:hypothetical protein